MPVSRKRKLPPKKAREARARNKRRGVFPGTAPQRVPPPPPLGIVEGLLRENRERKADPRDWVVFSGSGFIDGDGDVKIPLPEPPIPGVADKAVLVHKKRLAEWVGDKLAAYFWDGGRVPRRRRERMMAAEAAARSET